MAEAGRVGTKGRRCLPINYLQQQAPNHLAQVGEPRRQGEENMVWPQMKNESGEIKVGWGKDGGVRGTWIVVVE